MILYSYLARNPVLGKDALEKIKHIVEKPKCQDVRYFKMDITDKESIIDFKNHMVNEHGGLDILVNNAAIAYPV